MCLNIKAILYLIPSGTSKCDDIIYFNLRYRKNKSNAFIRKKGCVSVTHSLSEILSDMTIAWGKNLGFLPALRVFLHYCQHLPLCLPAEGCSFLTYQWGPGLDTLVHSIMAARPRLLWIWLPNHILAPLTYEKYSNHPPPGLRVAVPRLFVARVTLLISCAPWTEVLCSATAVVAQVASCLETKFMN